MIYHFKIYQEKNGYWGECIELEGCVSQGKTIEKLRANLCEALDLYIDEPSDSNMIFPEPKKRLEIGKDIIKIAVGPNIAFSYLLRKERIKNKLTQKAVALKLGVKNLYSYQRLEQSKTANPALNTIDKIKKIFPGLNLEEVFSQ